MQARCLLAVAGIAVLVLSCGDGTVEPPPPPAPVATSVTVSPGSATLTAIAETARFTAEVRDQNGQVMSGATVAWASSDASVAAVDASGQVTAAANGSATITATAGSVSGTAAVTVAQVVSAVTVTPPADTLVAFGDTVRLAAVANDANGYAVVASEFQWASSDTLVAVVDGSGLVTAAGNGTATITATAGSVSGTAAVTVAQEVSSVTVTPPADTLVAFGDTVRLVAEATDANGYAVVAAEFEWASSDTLVAVVDGSGLVESLAVGEVMVTATTADVTGAADLTVVLPLPATVAVSPDTVQFTALGQTAQLSAEVRDQLGRVIEGAAAAWSSLDAFVAEVDSTGLVTAAGAGETTITATAGDASGGAVVEVIQTAGSVVVSPAEARIGLGETFQAAAEAFDANGHRVSGAAFTWSSSNGSVATVDESGLVRGVGEGTARITATSDDASGAAEVSVGANRDRPALEAFYHATGGPEWASDDNWLTDAPLAEWHGVSVNEWGRVVQIDMYRNELRGTVPPEIGDLTWLRILNFTANSGLTGAVPAEIGRLWQLTELSFANTRITSLPPEFGNLRQLTRLDLHRTPFTSLPPEFGNLSALKYLDVEYGQLTSLPPEFANLNQLTILDLQGNRLAGAAPLRILANLTGLVVLDLLNNELTGTIPPELGGLVTLSGLNLASNNLEGAIPPELGRMRNLSELRLSNNAGLSGPLPASLAELTSLKRFWAGGTDLCAPESLREWLAGFTNRIRVCQDTSKPASAAYLTQAVQSLDFPVPLVADEPALLRVFAVAANPGGHPLPAARALFYHNNQEVHRVDLPSTGGALTSRVDESLLSSSLNAAIPAEIIQPGLEMVVELDPDGALDASLGLGRRVPAEGRLPVAVREAPALDLTLIPFVSVTNPDLSVVARTDGLTPEDPLFHDIHTLLPVREIDLTVHEPVETTASDPFQIVGEVIAIRTMEGATGHYMGTIAGLASGVAGVATTPGRASYAILEPNVMAHELGHNFSLLHAPCGTEGADPFFPQDDGTTGGWGYHFQRGALVSPENSYDLMSYCEPDWISDYSFNKALGFRVTDLRGRAAATAAATARSLLIWGGVEADGTPFLEPVFVVDAPPNLPQPGGGGYTIVGRAADGSRLFSLEFTMPTLADGDGQSRFAFAVPVMSDWTELASITLSGNQRSFTLDGEGDRAMAVVRDPATRHVRAILRSGDAREFAAAALRDRAAALSALQPRLEVLFSRGIPDLAASGR